MPKTTLQKQEERCDSIIELVERTKRDLPALQRKARGNPTVARHVRHMVLLLAGLERLATASEQRRNFAAAGTRAVGIDICAWCTSDKVVMPGLCQHCLDVQRERGREPERQL